MNHPLVYYEDFKYKESPELRDCLASSELQELIAQVENDVVIVLGWDGTMLSAIQKYHRTGKKFLGINFWHKWFLMNSKKALSSEKFITKTYPLLSAQVQTNKETFSGIATNEIDVRAAGGRMVTLEIELVGKKKIQIAGDGILVATPAWSTGYNSSLGWPIIPHSLPAFIITPKAPWKPKWQPPIVIHEDEILSIQDQYWRSELDIYIDGKPLITHTSNVTLNIQKNSLPLSLMIAEKELSTWENKVIEEQWFI